MKKRILTAVMACLLLLTLTACGEESVKVEVLETVPAEKEEPMEPRPAEEENAKPTETVTVRLAALTGPTAMGMVKMISDAEGNDAGIRYETTLTGAADELIPMILQGKLDIASVPTNLSSVLYNKTEGKVEMLAANVLGVLYIAEYGEEDIHEFADLKGKTIYATGKGATPEYFLRYVLTNHGIDPDKDLTIEWKNEPAEVGALLNADGKGIAMLPQPYVTAAAVQLGDGFKTVLSVSEGWEAVGDGSRCVTASIIVRKEFAEENPETIAAFLKEYAESAAWVNEHPEEAGELCGKYEIAKAPIAAKAIPYCNIVCITGADMKTAVSGCLSVLFDQNAAAVGGKLPGDDFYYGA